MRERSKGGEKRSAEGKQAGTQAAGDGSGMRYVLSGRSRRPRGRALGMRARARSLCEDPQRLVPPPALGELSAAGAPLPAPAEDGDADGPASAGAAPAGRGAGGEAPEGVEAEEPLALGAAGETAPSAPAAAATELEGVERVCISVSVPATFTPQTTQETHARPTGTGEGDTTRIEEMREP
jgi:hypothetical protein